MEDRDDWMPTCLDLIDNIEVLSDYMIKRVDWDPSVLQNLENLCIPNKVRKSVIEQAVWKRKRPALFPLLVHNLVCNKLLELGIDFKIAYLDGRLAPARKHNSYDSTSSEHRASAVDLLTLWIDSLLARIKYQDPKLAHITNYINEINKENLEYEQRLLESELGKDYELQISRLPGKIEAEFEKRNQK
jgi:hypothetical protein